MTQVLKPIKLGVLSVIMLIGIIAVVTELTAYEEVAKLVVIPSLFLLIIVVAYTIYRSAYQV